MISSALFIIVAESIVIFRPMFQVGMLQRLVDRRVVELLGASRCGTDRPRR